MLKKAALAILLILVSTPLASAGQEVPLPERPNILLILTDDQEQDSIKRMPKLQDQLAARGTTFENAFVTTPLCCPSRASILTGLYAHNHGVTTNDRGWQTFRDSGREASTVATWLHDAGYYTGYVGKYMNSYGKNSNTTTYVPPGWDQWFGWQGRYKEYGDTYKVNENGEIASYRFAKKHDTNYMAEKAEAFIRAQKGEKQPWLLVVATNAPHDPSFAPPRHQKMFKNVEMPTPPSFNEADVSDKPGWIQKLPRLSVKDVVEAERDYRQRLRSLQSVDGMVARLGRALGETDQAQDTYVIYTSDNGYLSYRHRVEGKVATYEESIGVPLVIRGPAVPKGATRDELAANVDLAPTIARWAGVRSPGPTDGRSLAPLLSKKPPAGWRRYLLIEYFRNLNYTGVRTAKDQFYVEHATGEKEFYDLETDPYQLESLHRSRKHQAVMEKLHARLKSLEDCSGEESCETAENAAPE